MSIVESLLKSVAAPAQRAKAVDVRVGAHWTVVLLQNGGTLRAGISSTLYGGDDHHHGGGPPVQEAGFLLEHPVPELIALLRSTSLLEASIGLATINALLDVDIAHARKVNAADVIAERGAGRRVAIVGHFPFTERIQDAAETLWVLELRPRPGDIAAHRAPEILPQADVVALTGTSLLNHTFDGLLEHCRPDAFVIVLGGTTPLSPVLLEAGVNAVAGTRIVNPEAALRSVSQGATFKQLRGKELLTLFSAGES